MDRLEAFDLVDPLKIAGQDFYAASGPRGEAPLPAAADLMDRLTDASSHYGMDTVFLSNSGAAAVENALKICYDHTRGKYAITFEGAFHGRTLGALSLNRSKEIYRRHFPEISTVHDAPFCADRNCDPTTCGCGFFSEDGSVLGRMLDPDRGYVNPEEVAYLILEPIQGEGGYRFPSEAFAEEIQAVCDEHDVLLIADEIQTGLGRTGEWWGSDHYAFEPDVIASAKALQVGATVASRDVFPGEKARNSWTWGAGDVLAALQGAVTIDVIEEQNLLRNARERGEQLKDRLREADSDAVENVRGKGLMVAFDLPSKAFLDRTVRAALERGLLTLGCGRRSMRLIPPLDVTEREIDLGVGLLLEAIDEVADETGR
jgi:4-aminobutyrate aminotransferase